VGDVSPHRFGACAEGSEGLFKLRVCGFEMSQALAGERTRRAVSCRVEVRRGFFAERAGGADLLRRLGDLLQGATEAGGYLA
jgi:hypothetical protein